MPMGEESVLDILCLWAEVTVEHPVCDERIEEEILLPTQSILLHFLTSHAEGRRELTEQSVDAMHRNLPYTEESEYVVNAVSIEILSHIGESVYPPLATIFQHLIPVVGREPPVLTVDRKVVRWCSSLSVKVEIAWFHPYVASISVYSDRNIALEHHFMLACILVGSNHLLSKNILHEIIECHQSILLSTMIGERMAVGFIP